jgi:hypothetical protein
MNEKDPKNMPDERLDFLIAGKDKFDRVPEDLDILILKRLKERKEIIIERKPAGRLFVPIAAAACVFIAVLIAYFFIRPMHPEYVAKVTGISGYAYLDKALLEKNKKSIDLFGKSLNTAKDSRIDLQIGKGTEISVGALSVMKLASAVSVKDRESTEILLDKGKIRCSVELPSSESSFKVMTDLCVFSVKGTIFEVGIIENGDVSLKVDRGIVEISNTLKPGAQYDHEIMDKIKEFDLDLSVEQGGFVILNRGKIKEYNKIFNNEMINCINKDGTLDKERFDGLIKKLDALKTDLYSLETDEKGKDPDKVDETLNKDTTSDKSTKIERSDFNPGLKADETGTSITSDGKKEVLISSDLDKSVTCIDISGKKVKWKFTDKRIVKINSPAIRFGGFTVIGTPEMIFVLDGHGLIKDSKQVTMGPSYWAYPVIQGKRVLIPSFGRIYSYEGSDITSFELGNRFNGQIYVMVSGNDLYFASLNDKKIFMTSNGKVIWQSEEMTDRTFMPPITANDGIFIADLSGNIYNFIPGSNYKKVVNTGAGIVTDMISYGSYIYFIAIDGYFYRVSAEKFDTPERLFKVDGKPSHDKSLVKKMLLFKGHIYYSGDTGKLFVYNTADSKPTYYDMPGNTGVPLAGSPVQVGDKVVIMDVKSNFYEMR